MEPSLKKKNGPSASVWSKNKGGGGGGAGPFLDPPLIRNSIGGGSLHLSLLLFSLFMLITEIFSIRLSVAIEENRE